MGVYPDIGLKDAREARDEARRLIAKGIDPSTLRKAEKLAGAGTNSFEAINEINSPVLLAAQTLPHPEKICVGWGRSVMLYSTADAYAPFGVSENNQFVRPTTKGRMAFSVSES